MRDFNYISLCMIRSLFQSDLVILDPITLAAFEDSGWYRVNHSAAGVFWWGRGDASYHNM